MTLKLIGAGFGRTGTTSLKAALEQLGLDKCYHMQEVIKNPAHVHLWSKAIEGTAIDWDALFVGYHATVDWPACNFYKPLMEVYPDAKVLLSVRDPQKWYESCLNTIYSIYRKPVMKAMGWLLPPLRRFMAMNEQMIWLGNFEGKFEDRIYAIAVFNRHNEEVKRYVPADRLLVFDVKEGWEPLCKFLGVPVPEGVPFPHLNDTKQFQRIFQVAYVVVGGVAAVGVGLLWWMFTC